MSANFTQAQIVGSSYLRDDILQASLNECDWVELRLDALPQEQSLDITALNCLTLPLIVTARASNEGGINQLSEQQRYELLKAWQKQAQAMDIELMSIIKSPLKDKFFELMIGNKTQSVATILSYHNFDKGVNQAEFTQVIEQALELKPDVIKLAFTPNTWEEVEWMAQFMEQYPEQPFSMMGMQELGAKSRIYLAKQSSCLNYGYLGEPTAPGQISAQELKNKLAE